MSSVIPVPAVDLLKQFGLCAENIVKTAKEAVKAKVISDHFETAVQKAAVSFLTRP